MEHDPKQAIEQKINDLKWRLTGMESDIGDWKIAKAQEYALVGLESPYDIADLHAKRQAVRDEINRLRELLASQ